MDIHRSLHLGTPCVQDGAGGSNVDLFVARAITNYRSLENGVHMGPHARNGRCKTAVYFGHGVRLRSPRCLRRDLHVKPSGTLLLYAHPCSRSPGNDQGRSTPPYVRLVHPSVSRVLMIIPADFRDRKHVFERAP